MLWLLLTALALASPFSYWVGRQGQPDHPQGAAGYRLSTELYRQLEALQRARPGAVRVEQIGHSAGGRPLWAFHVAEPGVPVRRKLLVFAGIHAMEWISTEVAVDWLLEVGAQPVRGAQITIIPVLNPDGRAKVESDLARGDSRTYRRGNQPNVDLNRDFALNREPRAVWRHLIPGYYGTSPGALSQPESRALDALAARERFDYAVSLHAFGGYFYFPWSGRWQRPADWSRLLAAGRVMQKAQGGRAYRPRQLARWGFFFRAQGTEIDHLYGRYGTHAYLIELTRSGLNPLRPRSFRTPFRWYNPVHNQRLRHKGVAALRALARLPPP